METAPVNPEVWYALTPDEFKNIRKALNLRFRARYEALDQMSGDNLNFLSLFTRLFTVDVKELCQDFVAGKVPLFKMKFLGGGKVGTAYAIEKGGDVLAVLKTIKGSKPPNYLSFGLHDYDQQYVFMTPSLGSYSFIDQHNHRKLLSVKSSTNFSNQTVQHLILNRILGDHPNYIHQYDAFWCGTTGYNVTEIATLGTMHSYLAKQRDLSLLMVSDAMRQILSALTVLKSTQYSFCHADLKAKNVFCSGGANGRPVFKIADFDKSSITYRGFRFYNSSQEYVALPKQPYPSVIVNGAWWYRFDTAYSAMLRVPLAAFTMHSPFGFYMSYDVYTMMLSCIAIPGVWGMLTRELVSGHVEQTPFTRAFVWLWQREDLDKIVEYVGRHGFDEFDSMSFINSFITDKGLRLRYDVDEVYTMFGVSTPERVDSVTKQIFTTRGGKICLSACVNSKCVTPTYSKRELTGVKEYSWDYC